MPYCKLCKDAGKPRTVWAGHEVRGRDGKLRCPTLANMECRYCHEKGHTPKYCKKLLNRQTYHGGGTRRRVENVRGGDQAGNTKDAMNWVGTMVRKWADSEGDCRKESGEEKKERHAVKTPPVWATAVASPVVKQKEGGNHLSRSGWAQVVACPVVKKKKETVPEDDDYDPLIDDSLPALKKYIENGGRSWADEMSEDDE